MSGFAEIVVTLPVEGRFTYRIPDHLDGTLEVGHRVLVPFGSRRVTGFVLAVVEQPAAEVDEAKLKSIELRLDPEPLLPEGLLKLAEFAAGYYLAPAGEVLKVALPPGFTGASKLRWPLSQAGRAALESGRHDGATLGPEAMALLEAAKGVGLTRAQAKGKLFKSLEAWGLFSPRDMLSARDGGGEVELLVRSMVPALAEPYLMGSKNRRLVYDALSHGPRPLAALRAELGASKLGPALKRLEADGVLTRRVVAASEQAEILAGPAHAREDAPRLALTEAQAEVLTTLRGALSEGASKAFLLQGVTGSGKTEVYLGLIEAALAEGKGAIVLVPEIALTPQLESRFRARFGDWVVVLHSGMADGKRREGWLKLRRGEARIVVGPRSAVWAPVERLGVMVVDEEHDGSFKQHNELRYHGRDLALARAHQAKAVAVLGSATPSLETLLMVERGRLERLRLDHRVGHRPMPTVEVVDLGEERRKAKGELKLVSRALEDALREVQDRKEQAIIFLNRRGFNTIVHCGACDEVKKCPHCDVSLTFHRARGKTACHYCGFEEALEAPCRKCRSREVRPLGAGTERVVDLLKATLPDLRIIRLDRDVTSKVGGLEETLGRFRAGEADVLVGTQMVAKGHDFPRVTLVGIILADASLAFPDFRAAERTFQLLTQVAGRAGRADRPGRVVIQTLQPDHYALTKAIAHDVDGFYELEAGVREDAGYPPFSRLGCVRVEGKQAKRVEAVAHHIAEVAKSLRESPELRVVGPSEAPIGRIRDRHRYVLLLFGPTPARLTGWMRRIAHALGDDTRGVDLLFDVDAADLL